MVACFTYSHSGPFGPDHNSREKGALDNSNIRHQGSIFRTYSVVNEATGVSFYAVFSPDPFAGMKLLHIMVNVCVK